MPTIDLTKVPELTPVPNGQYEATVVAVKPGVSQNGNEKFDVRWKIEGGEYDGRQIFDTMTFTEKSLWRTKQILTALGFDKDFAGALEPEDLIGKTCQLAISLEASTEIDPSTGEPYPARNRISKAKAIGESKSIDDLL